MLNPSAEISGLANALRHIENRVQSKKIEYEAAKKRVADERELLRNDKRLLRYTREALAVVQACAQQTQEQIHFKISGLVSHCLQAIFDDPYEFRIVFERKRNRTSARFVFERNGMEIEPMEAAGGGMIDVAAFALRVSCLILSRPPLRRVLILDEPFKFVSARYRGRIGELLEALAKELRIQFIIVTHFAELRIGKVIEIEG